MKRSRPLKRTRLRRRSISLAKKKRSAEAKQLRAEYLSAHPVCEYCKAVFGHPLRPATCVEHIWQRSGGKLDDVQNYAATCDDCHRWKHAHSREARVAITAYKLEHGTFDRDALRNLLGFDVIGKIEAWKHEGLGDFDDLAMGILERF